MIERCNSAGVRIYVDAVFNHMSSYTGYGSAGSYFNASCENYSSVPYDDAFFNDKLCTTPSGGIESWDDVFQVKHYTFISWS